MRPKISLEWFDTDFVFVKNGIVNRSKGMNEQQKKCHHTAWNGDNFDASTKNKKTRNKTSFHTKRKAKNATLIRSGRNGHEPQFNCVQRKATQKKL